MYIILYDSLYIYIYIYIRDSDTHTYIYIYDIYIYSAFHRFRKLLHQRSPEHLFHLRKAELKKNLVMFGSMNPIV